MPETTDKYVRIRVRDPGDFVDNSFRTVVLSEDQGIHSIMGKLKSDPDGSMVVQNYMFEVDKGWDMDKAQKWVSDHKEKKSIEQDGAIERRMCAIQELRIEGNDKSPRLMGYAALFDTPTEISFFGYGFKEKIQRGAFSESIKSDDIRMLFNHNPDHVLARNRSGTLTLKEDSKGLYFEAFPPDTQWARDLLVTIKRGDVSQNSFGFVINKDGDQWNKEQTERTLTSVKLYDVSPVTYPAYPQTEVWVRSKGNVYVSGLDKIFQHLKTEPDPTVVVPVNMNSQPKVIEPDPTPLISPEEEIKLKEMMRRFKK